MVDVTPPQYQGTSREIVPGHRVTITFPDTGATATADIVRVDFTETEAVIYVTGGGVPEYVPAAWATYIGPTPELYTFEAHPADLVADLDLLEADAGDAAYAAARTRIVAMLRAAIA